MKRKKLMAMLMAVSVFAGVLTGCGNTSGSNSGTSEQGQSEAAPQTEESAEEADAPQEETKEPLKFTMSISNGLNEYIAQSPDINQDKWVKVFNERYNLDLTLKLLDHKRFAEEMQMMFASGEIADVVKCYDNYTSPSMCQSVERSEEHTSELQSPS